MALNAKGIFDTKFVSMSGTIFKFLTSGLTHTLLAIGFGFAALVGIAAVGTLSMAGKWSIGTTFDEWYQSVGGSLLASGKYSPVDPNVCMFCDIFSRLFDMISTLGLQMFIFISGIVWTLVVMAFAVWLLMYVYRHILVEWDGSIDDLFTEVVKKVIVISMIGVLIGVADAEFLRKSANLVFENTALPIIEMGVGAGTKIIESPICDRLDWDSVKSEATGIFNPAAESVKDADGNILYEPSVKNDLLCFINSVNIVFFSGAKAGANMVHFSAQNPHPAALLDMLGGLAIVAIFFLLYLKVPLVMLDIIFTLGALVSMAPIMIAGYAYEDTREFSNHWLRSLWGIAFYIIMYSIFLGIIYSSFIYIGDAYYPGPIDDFTYLFPDFIYNDMAGSRTAELMENAQFKQCFDSAFGDADKVRACLSRIGSNIDFNMPSFERPMGSFMPIFSLGLLSLMIMGSFKSYANIISDYMMSIGENIIGFGKSIIGTATSVVRKDVGSVIGEKAPGLGRVLGISNQSDKIAREDGAGRNLRDMSERLARRLRNGEGE